MFFNKVISILLSFAIDFIFQNCKSISESPDNEYVRNQTSKTNWKPIYTKVQKDKKRFQKKLLRRSKGGRNSQFAND